MKFKQGLQNHYEKQQLSSTQMDQLMALQGASQTRESKLDQANKSKIFRPYVFASVIMLAVLSGWLYLFQNTPAQLYQAIANEVAQNHSKLKPLEIVSAQMPSVSAYFKQLNFEPRNSSNTGFSGLLLGGRYCSIQGEPAAQLRYSQTNGDISTLYQVPVETAYDGIPDLLRGQLPLRLYSLGYAVDLWQEQGLLMASVSMQEK